jgi:hypothetical protein
MQITCAKSGIPLYACDDGWQIKSSITHPIFLLEKPELFQFLAKRPAKSPLQRRLAFLALLDCTGLVQWAEPFKPADETIELATPDLLRLHSALDRLTESQISTLPQVRLAADVDALEILNVWNRLSRGLPVQGMATNADIALAMSEQWHKMAQRKLSAGLIEWAMAHIEPWQENAQLCKAWRAALFWTPETVQATKSELLKSLAQAAQDCLPLGDDVRHKTFTVQRHIQNLLDTCVAVMAELSGNRTVRKEIELAGVGSYQLVEISEEGARAEIASFNEPEPKREQFSRELDYIRARAAWQGKRFKAKAG